MDIPRLLELSTKYQSEVSAIGHFVPVVDMELAAANMMNTLNSDTGFAVVCVSKGKVVGFLWALVVHPVPWSYYKSADALMFYVEPEHRGKLHGYQLLKAYKSWAEEVECDELRLSTASGFQTERTQAVFKSLGFDELGVVYHIKKAKE